MPLKAEIKDRWGKRRRVRFSQIRLETEEMAVICGVVVSPKYGFSRDRLRLISTDNPEVAGKIEGSLEGIDSRTRIIFGNWLSIPTGQVLRFENINIRRGTRYGNVFSGTSIDLEGTVPPYTLTIRGE